VQIQTRRALQGSVLALGAPLGWLALRVSGGRSVWPEVTENAGLYLYLLVPTVLAFAVFGALLGIQEVRLSRVASGLRTESLTDELTGLKNLRYFRARLEEEEAATNRMSVPLALAIIDIDHFKRVNDRYGHPEGDRVLKAVASAISSVVRRGESVARVGGEEFAVLLPGADGPEAAAASERMRAAVARVRVRVLGGGSVINVAVSAGCASTADLGSISPDELYGAADAALYAAKRNGRDRTVRAGSLSAA